MGLLDKLARLFAPPNQDDKWADWITVKCSQCGEEIHTRVNLHNDLSVDYDEGGGKKYFCRKMIIGSNRCYAQIEVELTYNAEHKRIDRKIHGGTFVDEATPHN